MTPAPSPTPQGVLLELKHTPGPWRWEINEKCKQLQLCGGDPVGGYGKYDLTVMDFTRWGMAGAAPRFLDARTEIARMARADAFVIIAPGRQHHASWFKLLDHPDANLIAAAPDLQDAIEQALDDMADGHCVCEQTKQMLRDALAKATGTAS